MPKDVPVTVLKNQTSAMSFRGVQQETMTEFLMLNEAVRDLYYQCYLVTELRVQHLLSRMTIHNTVTSVSCVVQSIMRQNLPTESMFSSRWRSLMLWISLLASLSISSWGNCTSFKERAGEGGEGWVGVPTTERG